MRDMINEQYILYKVYVTNIIDIRYYTFCIALHK